METSGNSGSFSSALFAEDSQVLLHVWDAELHDIAVNFCALSPHWCPQVAVVHRNVGGCSQERLHPCHCLHVALSSACPAVAAGVCGETGPLPPKGVSAMLVPLLCEVLTWTPFTVSVQKEEL